MNQAKLYQYLGSVRQWSYIRAISDKSADFENADEFLIDNGPVQIHAQVRKGLDLSSLSFMGTSMGCPDINSGFLTTRFSQDKTLAADAGGDSVRYAGHIKPEETWENNDYVTSLSGDFFVPNSDGGILKIQRIITTALEKNDILVADTFINETSVRRPLCLKYCFNFGFPMANESTYLFLPTSADPRVISGAAQMDLEQWFGMEMPTPDAVRQVFGHKLSMDDEGNTFACVVNTQRQCGVQIFFNGRQFPVFTQIKSSKQGEYYVSLEIGNVSDDGSSQFMLSPFESFETSMGIHLLKGQDDIDGVYEQVDELMDTSL